MLKGVLKGVLAVMVYWVVVGLLLWFAHLLSLQEGNLRWTLWAASFIAGSVAGWIVRPRPTWGFAIGLIACRLINDTINLKRNNPMLDMSWYLQNPLVSFPILVGIGLGIYGIWAMVTQWSPGQGAMLK